MKVSSFYTYAVILNMLKYKWLKSYKVYTFFLIHLSILSFCQILEVLTAIIILLNLYVDIEYFNIILYKYYIWKNHYNIFYIILNLYFLSFYYEYLILHNID